MAESKYDDYEARRILGAHAQKLEPNLTKPTLIGAAKELLACLAGINVDGVEASSEDVLTVSVSVADTRDHSRGERIAMVAYKDGEFTVSVQGERETVSLTFNHAEGRFEGHPNDTVNDPRRTALAAIAAAIVRVMNSANDER